MRILLQVNVDADPAKAGFAPEVLRASLARPSSALPGLRVEGLMTVGSSRGATRRTRDRPSSALRQLSEALRGRASPGWAPALSMGMSDDFEVAVEEGATIVRVGRALFGDRPDPG